MDDSWRDAIGTQFGAAHPNLILRQETAAAPRRVGQARP